MSVERKSVRHEPRALIALLVGAAGTAFAPILVRVSELPPTSTAFYRMALTIPFIGLWIFLMRRCNAASPEVPRGTDRALLALTGLLFAGDLIALHWSITLTSIANAVLFLNSQPIFVVAGAWLLFGERASALFLAGLGLALAGAVLVMDSSSTLAGGHLLGDSLGILSGIFYAAYILAAVRLRVRFASLPIMAWTCAVASPILLIAAWGAGEALWPATVQGFGVLLALALIGQFAGNGLIVYAMAHLPAAFSAAALLSQPVIAAIFAWTLLGEPLAPAQMAGMAIVLGGICACRLGGDRAPRG